MRLPAWLPYRIRDGWDSQRIAFALRGLAQTPPIPATPVDGAALEIHLLLCRRDVTIGVLALKSLLRFPELRACVSITDDGSLTPANRQFVDSHIPGCRWLPARSDDPAFLAELANRPRVSQLYAGNYPPMRKLLHPMLLARKNRVLVLDADTATFTRPEQLIRWATGRESGNRFLCDRRQTWDGVPEMVRTAFAELGRAITPAETAWQVPHPFFNSGLLAFHPANLSLDVAEQFLKWRETADPSLRTGRNGIWFGEWTPEQTCFLVMFARLDPPAEPFDDGYGIGHGEPRTFRHFLRAGLVDPLTLTRLRRLIENIQTGCHG